MSFIAQSSRQRGLWGREFIGRGATRAGVEALLGVPSEKIAADVWIYWDNLLAGATLEGGQSDTLLFVFKDEAVADLRLVGSEPVRAAIARYQNREADGITVAGSQ